MRSLWNWVRREEGQDLTEYALIIALVVIVAVVAVTALGTQISSILSNVASQLEAAL